MTEIHSGQRGPIRQGFGMIRLESSGGDCPMGMSFWGKGVNPSYTHWHPPMNRATGPPPSNTRLMTASLSHTLSTSFRLPTLSFLQTGPGETLI